MDFNRNFFGFVLIPLLPFFLFLIKINNDWSDEAKTDMFINENFLILVFVWIILRILIFYILYKIIRKIAKVISDFIEKIILKFRKK